MKLDGGKWKRISWDTAMSEISAKLQDIRKKHGPDALMILGSAHHNNETSYALRSLRHSGGVTILTTRLEFATPPLWPGLLIPGVTEQ